MANMLPGWGQWLNGGYQTSGGNDAFMAELLKYDPNARLVGQGSYGGEGGGGGDAGYTLQYDASKLPKPPPGLDMNANGFGDHGYRGALFTPDDIRQDDFYGAYTPRENVNNAANDRNIVDIIGPLLVGAATMGGSLLGTAPGMLAAGFNTAGSGAFAAGGGAAGAGGGFSGVGSNIISRALQNAPRLLNTARSMFTNPTGPSPQQQNGGMSPQMLAMLQYLQQRQNGTGG